MAAESNTKIPRPLYAAAAVGDLAYQRLRKLPTTVTELRGRVAGVEHDADRLRGAAQRVERLRVAAARNAVALVTNAQAAQERAQAIYTDLVAKGEQVVRDRRVVHATAGIARPDAGSAATQAGTTQAGGSTRATATPEAADGPTATDVPTDVPGGTGKPAAKRTRPSAG